MSSIDHLLMDMANDLRATGGMPPDFEAELRASPAAAREALAKVMDAEAEVWQIAIDTLNDFDSDAPVSTFLAAVTDSGGDAEWAEGGYRYALGIARVTFAQLRENSRETARVARDGAA